MTNMNISLSAEFKLYIDAQVESGRYSNASEVVRACIRLHQDRNQDRRLERLALEALDEGVSEFSQDQLYSAKSVFRRELTRRQGPQGSST